MSQFFAQEAYDNLWNFDKQRLLDLGFTDSEAKAIVGMVYYKLCNQDATRSRALFRQVFASNPTKENVVSYLRAGVR
jgi:hypothetical protein